MSKNIIVRHVTLQDMAAVFALVQELALYEKAPEAVTTTVESYEQDFIDGIFEACVAELDGKVIGMVLYYMTFSTWKGKMLYLEDFVVREEYRGMGIGDMLFEAFLAEAKAKKCNMTKWQVLDWNEPAIKFYQKKNAIIEKEWWNVKIFLK